MHPASGVSEGRWLERCARARDLTVPGSPVSEILTFYAALTEYQASLVSQLAAISAERAGGSFVDAIDIEAAVAAVPDFLVWLRGAGPPRTRDEAAGLTQLDAPAWQRLLLDGATEGGALEADDLSSFVVEAVLQPFAEVAAIVRRESAATAGAAPSFAPRCPICTGRPVVGVLRESGEGARRALVCGLCFTEWNYLRGVCPGCDEQRFDRLPVYTSDDLGYVRIDACDTCRAYIKTVDLTKDGLAVPLVDDVASVVLDLWARDRGYRRLRRNIVRS